MKHPALLVLALVLLSPGPVWAQKQLLDRVVAVVNEEAITQSELDYFLRPLYEELKKEHEGEALARQFNEVRLKLLNQMIEDRLVYQEAKKLGITVNEGEVDAMVAELKSRFPSDEAFEKELAGQGTTLAKLREQYQRQIVVRRLHDMEIRSQVVVSPREIEDYYAQNPSEFAEEEKIKIRSVTIRKSEETADKGIVDEAAKAKIESVDSRIKAGEAFEKLAQEFSEDANAEKGGSAGWVKKKELLPSIDEVLFQLPAGAISPVLETPAGYHLFKIEEKKVSRIPPLEEVKEQIRGVIFRKKAQERFETWMNELKSRTYISVR